VIDAKDRRDREKKKRVSLLAKVACWLLIGSMASGMLLYIYLFAMRQQESRQNAWFLSFVIWLCFEVVVVSSLLVLVQQVILPSLASNNMSEVKKRLSEDIANFNAKGSQNQYKVLSKGESISEDRVQQQHAQATFNAAKYYFPSWRIARMYPQLRESALILNFSTPWPNRTFSLSTRNLSKAYSRKSAFFMQSASRVILYLLVGLVNIPSAAQDVIVQLFIVSGMGYVMILLVRLYEYSPALVVVPIVGGALLVYLAVSTGRYRESEALRRHQNTAKVADIDTALADGSKKEEPSGKTPGNVHSSPSETAQEEEKEKEPDQLRQQLRATINFASRSIGHGEDSGVAQNILTGISEGLNHMPALVPLPARLEALRDAHGKKAKKRRLKKRKVQPALAVDGYYASPKRPISRLNSEVPNLTAGSEWDNDGDLESDVFLDSGLSSCDERSPAKTPLKSALPSAGAPVAIPRSMSRVRRVESSDSVDTRVSERSGAGMISRADSKAPTELEAFTEKLMEENQKASQKLAQHLEERMAALEQSLLRQMNVGADSPGTKTTLPPIEVREIGFRSGVSSSASSRETGASVTMPAATPTLKRIKFTPESAKSNKEFSPKAESVAMPVSAAYCATNAKITRQLSDEISRFFFDSEKDGDEPDDTVQWEDAEDSAVEAADRKSQGQCEKELSLRPEDFQFDPDEVFEGGSDDEWSLQRLVDDAVLPLKVTVWQEQAAEKDHLNKGSALSKSERKALKITLDGDKKRERTREKKKKEEGEDKSGWVKEHESFESLV
jgi:hypothetical protein